MEEKYIDALKALSEPNRLRLFWLLVHIDKRISVAEAMDVTGDTQYNVSRNLKMLYKASLLTPRKQGKWVYYTLSEHKSLHWKSLVESIKLIPEKNFSDVTKRCLKRLSMRVNNECVIGANSEEWQLAMAEN
ncbi:winged helix-turn-helix transcriptional regulator [Colwellia sp. M166]|uniref:ArsR/SmtB family transcription factor n=1 Tax=Colwellia sp. M166 TaxID=2583805 RepID=UPI00211E878B|nr:metalloregulator ArsR/SmtB family transcription factor [Colwellia sp. M166]UUO22498.1 winged helix-turn-helix transcriptional regulator [Colwellia sp. M166]|tara:strand:+ start:3270 stop:3665 length:396 start_codon:yes stop_codon:yes gene_type:complete